MNWIKKLKEYAPDIASAVVTGGATLLPSALKIIAKETGLTVTDKADLESVVSGASHEVMLQIKEADQKFSIEMRKLSNELASIELSDVQHARESHEYSKMPAIITCLMTAISIGYFVSLLLIDIPEANRDMVNNYGGQMIALWVASVVYWVGTTRSSAEKDRKAR